MLYMAVLKGMLRQLLCWFTVIHLLGGHWGGMQLMAWSSMLQNYSQGQSLVSAIYDTFSGTRPCEQCLKLQKGYQEERQQQGSKPLVVELHHWNILPNSNFHLPSPPWDLVNPLAPLHYFNVLATQWSQPPTAPPPRCVAV